MSIVYVQDGRHDGDWLSGFAKQSSNSIFCLCFRREATCPRFYRRNPAVQDAVGA